MARKPDRISTQLYALGDALEKCQTYEELAEVEEKLNEINRTISDSIQNITAECVQIESEIREIDTRMEDLCEKLDHWSKYQAVVADDYSTLDAEYNSLLDRKRELYRLQEDYGTQLYGLGFQHEGLQRLADKKSELAEQLHDTVKVGGELGRNLEYVGKTIAENTAKTIAMTPVTLAKSGAKSAFHAAENATIGKKADMNATSDTGIESVRLGYGAGKKGYQGIKTVGRTIKTTKRNIKTTKTVAKETAHAVKYTGKVAVKAVTVTVKAVGTAATHIAAAATSPVFWIVVLFLLMFIMIAGAVLVLLGGGTAARSTATAYSSAAGLKDVPAQYQAGQNFFQIAVQNQRNGFNAIFDGMYYSDVDLGHSNLVYMERTKADDTVTKYQKAFANPNYRTILKNQWEFAVTETEAIAIAYVYLEKTQNTANGTTNEIYEVSFDQAAFDTIVANCIIYNDTVYAGQQCPESVCSRHVIQDPNPDYETALATNNLAAEAYNDWVEVAEKIYYHNHMIWDGASQIAYWNNIVIPAINEWIIKYNRDDIDTENDGDLMLQKLGMEYLEAASVLQNTPPTIETIVYNCDLQHELHSVGLYFYDKENVMNALGFTDAEKQWAELTKIGFENNPNIP